jgi:cell division septum initiation protein DivIVA
MINEDLRDQIAQLEVEIEQLAETLERCRKAMLISQVAIGAAVLWILAYLVGIVGLVPAVLIGAISVFIGGVVIYGSNASTSKRAAAAMKDAEILRAELIDRIDPRTVSRSNQLI